MYSGLFNKIDRVVAVSDSKEENWGSLKITGRYRSQYSKSIFSELKEVFEGMGKVGCITSRVENTPTSIDELLDSLEEGVQWTVNINKQSFMGSEERVSNFFYSLDCFKQWADNTNPFSANNPFNSHECRIEVNGLPNSFGGPSFLVTGSDGEIHNDARVVYDTERLKTVVRQFTGVKKEILPEKHYVAFGDVDEYSSPFYRNSLQSFTLALCDELYEDKVVLRGVRRLEFGIEKPEYDRLSMVTTQESLRKAFCWVYGGDAHYELRHKLLMDRLTLDLPQNQSFYLGVLDLISDALRQASEQFNYAFFERSNECQKELRQFLKELHSLCDSYSTKVRSLLGSFLRDSLAGFMTVAITMFANVGDYFKTGAEVILSYIFCAYGVYLLISCIFQVVVDWRDLSLSEKEIDYWKIVSREYMRKEDFETHKKKTVGERKCWAIRQYINIGVVYLALAVFSFNVPNMWEKLSVATVQTELQGTIDQVKESDNSFKNIILQNGKDTISRDGYTKMCHSQSGKQE